MKIAIAGYGGMIGKHLIEKYRDTEWIHLPRELLYGEISRLSENLRGVQGVINLAGSPIARRWTKQAKREIEASRSGVNTRLVSAINQMENKPDLFVTASAIGIYGSSDSYLTKVVQGWEAPLQELDTRVRWAILRIGVVLDSHGGALAPLLKMTRLGLTPNLGSNTYFYSFVHVDDLVDAIQFILEKRADGIINICSPYPVDNATFAKTLAQITGRKFILPIPTIFLKLLLGEAHSVVTEGPQVLPGEFSLKGFKFNYPELGDALKNLVQKH